MPPPQTDKDEQEQFRVEDTTLKADPLPESSASQQQPPSKSSSEEKELEAMKEEAETEDESLEALAQQLDTITGVVSSRPQSNVQASTATTTTTTATTTATTSKNNSKSTVHGDVAVLVPGKIILTCRLTEYESIESKWGFSLLQQQVIGGDDDDDDKRGQQRNNEDNDGIPIRPKPKTTRVVITDVSDTSPLSSLWATGAVIVLEKVNRRVCTNVQQTYIWIA